MKHANLSRHSLSRMAIEEVEKKIPMLFIWTLYVPFALFKCSDAYSRLYRYCTFNCVRRVCLFSVVVFFASFRQNQQQTISMGFNFFLKPLHVRIWQFYVCEPDAIYLRYTVRFVVVVYCGCGRQTLSCILNFRFWKI